MSGRNPAARVETGSATFPVVGEDGLFYPIGSDRCLGIMAIRSAGDLAGFSVVATSPEGSFKNMPAWLTASTDSFPYEIISRGPTSQGYREIGVGLNPQADLPPADTKLIKKVAEFLNRLIPTKPSRIYASWSDSAALVNLPGYLQTVNLRLAGERTPQLVEGVSVAAIAKAAVKAALAVNASQPGSAA